MDETTTASRKRKRNVENWKREREKKKRYAAKGLPKKPTCNHKKKQVLRCHELGMQDIRRFHERFYKHNTKVQQDEFILRYTSQKKPNRSRATKPNSSRKTMTVNYFVNVREGNKLQVCQKTFLSILGLKKDRVQLTCKKHLETGCGPEERRGGRRHPEKFEDKRKSVKDFIEKLQPVDSHYSRHRSTRKYLPSELSIRSLWNMYCASVEPNLVVKYDYFRVIFISDYNISFKCPSTDVCSECQSLKEKLKMKLPEEEKNQLMVMLRVHKLKAKCFTEMIQQESPYIAKFSFDCQKNMILPKVADQAAYYSRQMYCYNFTICIGGSKSAQTRNSVRVYTWLENERPKGSNEITSAINHLLRTYKFSEEIEVIELFCDGCPGQNKNSTLIGMLGFWLETQSPPNIIEAKITFPVVGHSYLPPDRVFGRIEKEVRRREVIVKPEDYYLLFEKQGTVQRLGGAECVVSDWKTESSRIMKNTSSWHFKLSQCKRISLKKTIKGGIVVKGEVNYKSDISTYKSLLKKDQSYKQMEPNILPLGIPVKKEKLTDVENLLQKHYGHQWRSHEDLTYYKNLMDSIQAVEEPNIPEEEVVADDILEAELPELRI